MKDNNDNNKKRFGSDFVDRDAFVNSDEPMPEVSGREIRQQKRLERKQRLRAEKEQRLREELLAQKKLRAAKERMKKESETEQKAQEDIQKLTEEEVFIAPAEESKLKDLKEDPNKIFEDDVFVQANDEEQNTAAESEESDTEVDEELKKLEKKQQKAQIKKNRESIILIKHDNVVEDDEDEEEPQPESVLEEPAAEPQVTPYEEEEPLPREKTKKKEKKKAEQKARKTKVTDIRSARKKQKMKKRIKVLIALLIVAAFGLTVYLTRGIWVPKLEGILDRPHATIVNDGKTAEGNYPIQFDETSVNIVSPFKDCFIKVDDNHIVFYDETGNVISTTSHSYANPVVRTAGKRALVYDRGGHSFTLLNKNGELFSREIEDTVMIAEIGSNSNIAVITQNDRYEAVMTVYDSDGVVIYKWQSYKKVIDITFNESGDGCYITTFKSENGMINSYITGISFDSEEEVMQSSAIDDLVLDTLVNDNEDQWVIGLSNFYKLDNNGNILFKYEYSGDLIDYSLSSTTAAVVVSGVGKGNGILTIFRSDSDSNNPNSMIYTEDGQPKKLHSSSNLIILLCENKLNAYDKAGNLLATASVSSDYVDFAYLNDAVYFLDVRELNKIGFKT